MGALSDSGVRGGTNTASARWVGGWRCEVDAGGFPLVVDEPIDVGGTGAGPMPTDLLLAALSSCYALALAWAARKRGIELPDVTVDATGTYHGQTFSSLILTVTSSAPAEQLTPLLEPARRVCYVSNTIAGSPPITVELVDL
ncbi:MAG: OsmC family protein [Candidatus Nanopelagicales bacterium]